MMYQGDVVMIAMAATALLVIALTIFAFQVFFIFDNFQGITNETCFRRRLISQCVAASSSVSSLCFSSLDF